MRNFFKLIFGILLLQLTIVSCEDSNEPVNEKDPEQIAGFPVPGEDSAVDLGLSVRWAPYNVGAAEPKDFGNYYAWGEIEPKKSYTTDNYFLNPYMDVPDVFGTNMDVAHVKWGAKWRIPTIEETIELVKKCKWEEVKIDGVRGMKVTGPTGNYIFLPAAGRYVDYRIEDMNEKGHYWQGSTTASGEEEKLEMYYYDLNQVSWGLSIRPVWAD